VTLVDRFNYSCEDLFFVFGRHLLVVLLKKLLHRRDIVGIEKP